MIDEIREKFDEIYDGFTGMMWEFDKMLDISEEKSKRIIKNIDEFIYKLKDEDLYTDDLGMFIERYLIFYNK